MSKYVCNEAETKPYNCFKLIQCFVSTLFGLKQFADYTYTEGMSVLLCL